MTGTIEALGCVIVVLSGSVWVFGTALVCTDGDVKRATALVALSVACTYGAASGWLP